MTTVGGAFNRCKSGGYATTISCTGSTCGKLHLVPGLTCTNTSSTSMTCTNSMSCTGFSNVTSSFSMLQKGLDVTQSHNITIGSKSYTLTGNGTNFTAANATTKASATPARNAGSSLRLSRREPHSKLLMLLFLLMLSAQALAQSAGSPFASINDQYSAGLGSLLDPLEQLYCGNADLTSEDAAIDATSDCLSLLTQAESLAEGPLVSLAGGAADAAGGSLIGSVLPIVDAELLLVAVIADVLVCFLLLTAVFVAEVDPEAICDALSSDGSMPTAMSTVALPTETSMAASATAATTSSEPSAVPSDTGYVSSTPLPPGWPTESTFLHDPCISCLLTDYFTEIEDFVSLDVCGVTNATLSTDGYELAQVFCQENLVYPSFCQSLCNTPCEVWNVQTLIASMGRAYMPTAAGYTDWIAFCAVQCRQPNIGSANACAYAQDQPNCNCGYGQLSCEQPGSDCATGVPGKRGSWL